MRAIPGALQAHLDEGTTTLCQCWRVTRRDGLVQGFTEHDEDLVFDGTTFAAGTGFTASEVQQTLGLAVDNLSVEGALSSEAIGEADLAAGRYDDAFVELFRVNWRDASQRILVMTGYTGEARRQGIAFSAELRGLTARLGQTTIRVFQRTCDARLGDGRCKVDLDLPANKGTATILVVSSPRLFTASGLAGFATDWFSQGVLTFTTGANAGLAFDVKEHVKTAGGTVTLELWGKPTFAPAPGDGFTVTAGCKLTAEICQAKFANIANFQGFPAIPGNDAVLRNPDPNAGNSGGSTTTSGGKGM